MEKITTILSKKEFHLHTVAPGSTVKNALSQMCCENVDYLVVVDDDERYLGLITEHDIANHVISSNKQLNKMKVQEIMNNRLPVANTDDSVEKCMQMMQQHHVRYLPVFENFNFRGIVSSEDILDEAVNNRMKIFDAELVKTGRFGALT